MYKKFGEIKYILILFVIFILIIFSIHNTISITEIINKSWLTHHRDDIVFVYNSLLYADGLEQHYLDHPSLFTFLIFPIFYKLFYLFGYLDFFGLDGFLKSQNFNEGLNKLYFISQLIIYIFSFLTICVIFKISKKFSSRNLDSFIITVFFLISTGFVAASNRIESGLIAFFFIILSFYLFLRFVENINKKNIIFFILSLILIFSSMMQKKIIYFVIPFFYLSSFMFLRENDIIYYKYKIPIFKVFNYKIGLFVTYLLAFSFIALKTLFSESSLFSRDIDFIFLILNYSGFNLLLFFFIKYYQNNNFENLLTYNIILVSFFYLYKYLLIYFFSANVAIWSISFTNFMGHLNMFVSNNDLKHAFEFSSITTYLEFFVIFFKKILIKYIFSFSFQSLLLWTNIILFSLFFKKIRIKEKISIISLCFGFLFVQSIFLFRYEQDTYYLNSEFFLLFSLAILLKYITPCF